MTLTRARHKKNLSLGRAGHLKVKKLDFGKGRTRDGHLKKVMGEKKNLTLGREGQEKKHEFERAGHPKKILSLRRARHLKKIMGVKKLDFGKGRTKKG